MFARKKTSKIPILVLAFAMLLGGLYIGKFLEKKEETQVIKPIVADNVSEDIQDKGIVLKKGSIITFKTLFTKCNDVVEKTENIPDQLVGADEENVKKYIKSNYPAWNLIEFDQNMIVLFREINSYCQDHYEIGQEEGKLVIYKYDEEGRKQVVEKTEYPIEHLPEIDQEKIKNGIVVNSLEEVNQLLEDFGS
ncbi:BofC C-terminal domain-containing protein [Alkalithermobacter thermoalcaliphilus JW-YL-7 = DSM 7308]|uniref:BofC C-terminal domain-containing protein n=1 Tax=Alkalithermobacter thermoalcaliphilus JW-YL-7 = DSM 7308 TaxID=1121328 RepID=A0A150FP98_CLOPD|nr:hypothetical protein JWYL7_0492 [[Clostridium] paradoxum JW-YL-7 = DSM 7308]SHK52482.1 BofC C-terminal domain-containing protein [[Clostridium] paradoxum JW-YL-7 = DSM 7308]